MGPVGGVWGAVVSTVVVVVGVVVATAIDWCRVADESWLYLNLLSSSFVEMVLCGFGRG